MLKNFKKIVKKKEKETPLESTVSQYITHTHWF